MIQHDYKDNVQEVSGEIETTGFNIEVNESMFQMLTSNVYNDTILAVMREWSTNACDACIAADKQVNFDVHLPTLEEPLFSVRDYGTGLCPEDIVGLFSNLGASTKRNSNAYNGTLGIGRMAGLAVADGFTVESFYNGMHYTYVISMQKGVPVTMNLGNQPTEEANGLKLSVAVEPEDVKHYVEKASKLYKYFDYKPNINLDIDMELDISEHISSDWFIMKTDSNSYYNRSNYVVMSQVLYEIPSNSAINNHDFQKLVIKAEPGAVTFNPGRESLSLNKQTIDYLNSAFNKIKDEYLKAADTAMSLTTNDKELMETYDQLYQKAPYHIGTKLDPMPYMSNTLQLFADPYGTGFSAYHRMHLTSNFLSDCSNLLTLSYKTSYHKTSKEMKAEEAKSWKEFFKADHVIVDLKTKFKAALNEHYARKPLVIWQRQTGEDLELAVTKAKDYLDTMGIPYKLASQLVTQLDTATVSKNLAPREGFYAAVIDIYGNVSKHEQMTDYKTDQYLYVKLKHSTPILMDESISFNAYLFAYRVLARNISDIPLIKGVAKKYQDVVDDLDNWVDFESYIKDKVTSMSFQIPFDQDVPIPNQKIINSNVLELYPKELQDYYQELTDYHNFRANDKTLQPVEKDVMETIGASFETYQPTKEVDLEYLEVTYPESYPLLTTHTWGYCDTLKPELVARLAHLEKFYAIHSSNK